jgi:hypothetical protein
MTETISLEDEETSTHTTDTPITTEYGTAVPLFLNKTSSKAILNNSPRKSGGTQSINAAQPRGFGILPDTSTASGTTERDEDDDIDDSSSDDIHLVFQGTKRPFEPIFSSANTTTSLHHSPSIGFPSITTKKPGPIQSPRSPPPTHSKRSSWADFDFDIPFENKLRRKPESDREKKTFSWLDDVSKDSILDGDEGKGMGRERVRSWKLGRRGEEMGWDGPI